jgi:hypothetical protein
MKQLMIAASILGWEEDVRATARIMSDSGMRSSEDPATACSNNSIAFPPSSEGGGTTCLTSAFDKNK